MNLRFVASIALVTIPAVLHADIWTDTGEDRFSDVRYVPVKHEPAPIPLYIPHIENFGQDEFYLLPELRDVPTDTLHLSHADAETIRIGIREAEARAKAEAKEKARAEALAKRQEREAAKKEVSPQFTAEQLAKLPAEVRRDVERFLPDCSMGLIYIDKQALTLTLYDAQAEKVVSYGCAVGLRKGHKQKQGDMRTPEGCFKVQQIQPADTWGHDFKDGKGYIPNCYGNWFIRLRTGFNGIGIHGTHAPESIGTRATEGCIRLKNDDLDQFKPLVQKGMAVIIGADVL